jgi:hypothetical protein
LVPQGTIEVQFIKELEELAKVEYFRLANPKVLGPLVGPSAAAYYAAAGPSPSGPEGGSFGRRKSRRRFIMKGNRITNIRTSK